MRRVHIKRFSIGSLLIAAVLAVMFICISVFEIQDFHLLEEATDEYLACEQAARKLQKGSDLLTEQVRLYTMTGKTAYLDGYFQEADVTRSRESAVAELDTYFSGTQIMDDLTDALDDSRALMKREIYAMRLVAEAQGTRQELLPAAVRTTSLDADDLALSCEEQLQKARDMVSDDVYQNAKAKISQGVEQCLRELLETTGSRMGRAETVFKDLYIKQELGLVLLFAFLIGNSIIVRKLIVNPLVSYNECIKQDATVPLIGAAELQSLAETYNRVFMENQESQKLIRHEAEYDALTDLLNRGSFNKALTLYSHGNVEFALILIDVDHFKTFNDTYGHAVGDEILRKVARRLKASFRSTDYIFRIGGDEFAVLMIDVSRELRRTVEEKLTALGQSLMCAEEGSPAVTLSIGVAVSRREDSSQNIFQDADVALYEVKEHGRNGYRFYGG